MLAYDVAGDGPPLLLIHAGVADARMWAPLTERLRGRFQTIAPDLPGFGRTPPSRPFDPAGELIALLDGLGVARTAVAGASFGGWVAMELATRAPARVGALALLATAAPGAEPSPALADFDAAEAAALAAGDVERAITLNVETWVRDPAIAPLVADMARIVVGHQLEAGDEDEDDGPALAPERFAMPVLLVDGGRDLPDFAAIADRLADVIPGARRATVPDAGHLVALERPDAVAKLLTAFLREDSW
jgi:pimeloyl-ACP methyl ester carboxylesterase